MWVLGLALLAAAPAGVKGGALVERVVAVVDHQTITLLEVRKAALVEVVRAAGPQGAGKALAPSFLADMREHMVSQALALAEAARAQLPPPPERDMEQALQNFKGRFASERDFAVFLRQNDLSLDDVREISRKVLRVDRFLEQRVRARIEATPQEIAAFRAAHPEASVASDAEIAREITKTLFVERAKLLFAQLRERADVRLIGGFE